MTLFSNKHIISHSPTQNIGKPKKTKKTKTKVKKMRASTRLLWKLSVIVLLTVVSEAHVDPEPDLASTGQNKCQHDDEAADVTEYTARREAAEIKPPQQGKRQGKKHGGGAIPQGAEMNWPGKWELFIKNSGISAMHAILMPLINKVQFYDATIWRISQIKLPPGVPCHVYDVKANKIDCWAHSVLVDIETGNIRPLAVTKLLLFLFFCFILSVVLELKFLFHYKCCFYIDRPDYVDG